MANITFEEVYALAVQLPPEEQTRLAEKLQLQKSTLSLGKITREALLAEFERRKAAGLFENEVSLYGKYAYPVVDLSLEELQTSIKEFTTEWENELDEFFGED